MNVQRQPHKTASNAILSGRTDADLGEEEVGFFLCFAFRRRVLLCTSYEGSVQHPGLLRRLCARCSAARRR